MAKHNKTRKDKMWLQNDLHYLGRGWRGSPLGSSRQNCANFSAIVFPSGFATAVQKVFVWMLHVYGYSRPINPFNVDVKGIHVLGQLGEHN